MSKTEITDTSGMAPVQQIKDIATCKYQVTGLEDGIRYYFAVTAVDKSGSEGVQVASVSATPAPMLRGTVDTDIYVDVYQSELAWAGTTLFGDQHNPEKPRIIEVNMLGEIVWQSAGFEQTAIPVRDANRLPNGNTLITGTTEIVEVTPGGGIVWQLSLKGVSFSLQEAAGLGFYKADRISAQK